MLTLNVNGTTHQVDLDPDSEGHARGIARHDRTLPFFPGTIMREAD